MVVLRGILPSSASGTYWRQRQKHERKRTNHENNGGRGNKTESQRGNKAKVKESKKGRLKRVEEKNQASVNAIKEGRSVPNSLTPRKRFSSRNASRNRKKERTEHNSEEKRATMRVNDENEA